MRKYDSTCKSFQVWKVHFICKCRNFPMPANRAKVFICDYSLLVCNVLGIVDAFAHDTNVLAHLIINPPYAPGRTTTPCLQTWVLLKVLLDRRPRRLFIDTIDQHHIRCFIYRFALKLSIIDQFFERRSKANRHASYRLRQDCGKL